MTSKSRKSLSLWITCDKCFSTVAQKNITTHEIECPPSDVEYTHSYIQNSTLHSTVEIYEPRELPKNITDRHSQNMVFISELAMEICNIAIGAEILLSFKNGTIVRTAWPLFDKTLTSICLKKKALDIHRIDGRVKVKNLDQDPKPAKEIIIEYASRQPRSEFTDALQKLLKCDNVNKVYTVNNRIHLPHYGRNLIFKIIKIIEDDKDINEIFEDMRISENKPIFYRALDNTKYTLIEEKKKETENNRVGPSLENIGGYQELIEELRIKVNFTLDNHPHGFNINRGILLHGNTGVGKTTIANFILSECGAKIFSIDSSEISSKLFSETETYLKDIFSRAKSEVPSVILFEDIDKLFPEKNGSIAENEKRILNVLIKEIDSIQQSNCSTLLLATSLTSHSINSALNDPRRIGSRFEVTIPTVKIRREILAKFLTKIPNKINEEELDIISSITHGFVASGLQLFCSEALCQANKRHLKEDVNQTEILVTLTDFNNALKIVKPLVIKGVLPEVPNVSWSEIGGQKSLKLQLKQAVEWPLTHPEAFSRLGIKPSKGVLMFGPPGCSKTMVAKALATESKLNFFNVKGPELFSKWVGESEENVRKLFRTARQVAPSIIFIDEIDSLGGERAMGDAASAGSSVQERVLTQLLVELDGVEPLGNVTLVAATNRPDRIDQALLRNGRFDRAVYVPLPDYETRMEIFQINFRKMPIKDIDISDLVKRTDGYSGAEIEGICKEAGFRAMERDFNTTDIIKDDFEYALSVVKPRTDSKLMELYKNWHSRFNK